MKSSTHSRWIVEFANCKFKVWADSSDYCSSDIDRCTLVGRFGIIAPRSVADPRVKDWLWMHSPLPTLIIIFLYLMMVRYGPRLMKNRAPFEMKPVLLVFNTGVVAFYAYLVKEVSGKLLVSFRGSFYWGGACMGTRLHAVKWRQNASLIPTPTPLCTHLDNMSLFHFLHMVKKNGKVCTS